MANLFNNFVLSSFEVSDKFDGDPRKLEKLFALVGNPYFGAKLEGFRLLSRKEPDKARKDFYEARFKMYKRDYAIFEDSSLPIVDKASLHPLYVFFGLTHSGYLDKTVPVYEYQPRKSDQHNVLCSFFDSVTRLDGRAAIVRTNMPKSITDEFSELFYRLNNGTWTNEDITVVCQGDYWSIMKLQFALRFPWLASKF